MGLIGIFGPEIKWDMEVLGSMRGSALDEE